MNKIVIIGNSGGGKSTLANRLGELLNIPVLHMDILTHDEYWDRLPSSVVDPKLQEFMAQEAWIIEGQYRNHCYEERLSQADIIVLFDFNRFHALYRSLKRWRNVKKGKEKHHGVDQHNIPDMDSWFVRYLLWIYPQTIRPGVVKELREYKEKLLVLRNNEDIERFVRNMSEKFL